MKKLSFSKLDAWCSKMFYYLTLVMLIGVQLGFLAIFVMVIWEYFWARQSIYSIIAVIIGWSIATAIVLSLVLWARKNIKVVRD